MKRVGVVITAIKYCRLETAKSSALRVMPQMKLIKEASKFGL